MHKHNEKRYFIDFFKKYKFKLFFLIVLSIIIQATSVLSVYLTGNLIDCLINKQSNKLPILILIILILEIINIVFSNIKFIKNTIITTDLVFHLNSSVVKFIKKLPISYFENTDTIYLNNQINDDSNNIVGFVTTNFIDLFVQIIIFISISVIMIKINIVIYFISISTIPIYIILIYIFENILYKNTMTFKIEQNKFMSKINRQLKNISFIKINVLFEKLDNELEEGYLPLKKSIKSYSTINAFFSSTTSMVNTLFFILFLIYGSYSILNNYISIGDFIIIQSYHTTIMSTVSFFLSFLKLIPEIKVSIDRLNSIIKNKQEHNGKIHIDNIKNLKAENIYYKDILTNFSISLEKGHLYSIKGSNGSGKTTLLNTISGCFINDYKGTIKINDINIKELDMYKLRKNNFSFVEQFPTNLYDDFFSNINLKKTYCNELIISTLKSLNFDVDIIGKKIDSINDKQVLSGGEEKKLSIARAIIENSDVILMDEPTASLDKSAKDYLFRKLKTLKNNKIIVIVTHDDFFDEISDEIINI